MPAGFRPLLMALALGQAAAAFADTTEAVCVIYPRGQDHSDVTIPCTFSQRQGAVTIARSDNVTHSLLPSGDQAGNFTDESNRLVYRQSGLGARGVIFRFPEESVYVYWDTDMLARDDDPAQPFTTDDYDATTLLRCKPAGAAAFERCPAGILRMENEQASIVVEDTSGERFTINFMADYVNATNREVEARLDGDTWVLEFGNGEVWEVPLAAIQGG